MSRYYLVSRGLFEPSDELLGEAKLNWRVMKWLLLSTLVRIYP